MSKVETYAQGAARETKVELGIEANLSFAGKFASKDSIDGKTILEFNAIYEGHIKSSTPLKLQKVKFLA